MKKFSIAFLVAIIVSLLFAACSSGAVVVPDGTYRAEYEDYDHHGFKDFVEITFEGGAVTEINADAVNEKGEFKYESEAFRKDMESLDGGTYPEKYYKDLINQYLANPSAEAVDVVAGATLSSNSFKTLAQALERAVRAGDTDVVVVKR
ncbi:MAG: FMN-binding protein [Ruminococcaceae bacterium]|nr:FMN-binding protein [Oscillospiraceae bacterium]